MTSLPFEDLPKRDIDALFDEWWPKFWKSWPNKVDKQEAAKKFRKALRIDTPANIIKGRDTYIRCKPAWQAWMGPAKFLHGQRWKDVYGYAPPKPDEDAVWRDKAARMIKYPEYKQPRQDVEEAFRRGLITEEQRDAAL